MNYLIEYKKIAERFVLNGKILDIQPYGNGLIHLTFLVTTDKKRYILQKINTKVFAKPVELMQNVCAVTEHLKSKNIETLSVIPTKDGKPFLYGEQCFRVYDFIENSLAFQSVCNKKVLYNAGKALGNFQNSLVDFDASLLSETILDFHNTPKYFDSLQKSIKENKNNRVGACEKEIELIFNRAFTYSKIVDGLKIGEIPFRVSHNDTQLNNILFDKTNNKVRAIIDLDTVMKGSMLYDFGDFIRLGASTSTYDEKDPDKVHFSLDFFKAFSEGFCSEVRKIITENEKKLLPYSAYIIAMEDAIRFLTDYIKGDVFFTTKYPEHNLIRAKTQIKLASEIEQKYNDMKDIINNIFN